MSSQPNWTAIGHAIKGTTPAGSTAVQDKNGVVVVKSPRNSSGKYE